MEINLRGAVTKKGQKDLDWRKPFMPYWQEVEALQEELAHLEATDPLSAEAVLSIGTSAKKLAKDIKEQEKIITESASSFIKAVRKFTKPWLEKLEQIECMSKSRLALWTQAEKARREEEARSRYEELMQDLQSGPSDGMLPALIKAEVDSAGPLRTESGSAYTITEWTWDRENVQFDLVPNEYKALDEAKITKAVKAGIRNIPGIRIYQVERVRFRTC